MPIEIGSEIRVFSEDEFHVLAHKVIGTIFGIHNDLGRLVNEEIYKQAIRRRCEAASIIPARREVEIKVVFRDFEKSFFMDLLFAYGLMVELKTVEKINNTHRAQVIHYLLLAGMRHGLLVNLRPGKVEKQFVSTTLDLEKRRHYVVRDSDWLPVNEASHQLRRIVLELFDDWGTFLQTTLYRAAIIHFFGGPQTALRSIPIFDGDVQLGTQEVCLIADDTALSLTALKDGKESMKDHLCRFLSHTQLSYLQWINMDNHDIEFRTLTR